MDSIKNLGIGSPAPCKLNFFKVANGVFDYFHEKGSNKIPLFFWWKATKLHRFHQEKQTSLIINIALISDRLFIKFG